MMNEYVNDTECQNEDKLGNVSLRLENQIKKVIMVDLDGTLFDTREVNYRAYQEAMASFGYKLEYSYYCEYCNGRHYLDFLPSITTEDKGVLEVIHKRKTEIYGVYLDYANLNKSLVEIMECCRSTYYLALVTTASKKNTYEILNRFNLNDLFDLILTHEDVMKGKPDPEGYVKAMNYFKAEPSNCIVFEDSDVGIEAAEKAGAMVFVVKGYS